MLERGIYEIVDTESLVSAEHLLRKIDAAFDWNKEAKKKTVTKSTTDPNAGMFVKGDHKRQMAYEAHTVCKARFPDLNLDPKQQY